MQNYTPCSSAWCRALRQACACVTPKKGLPVKGTVHMRGCMQLAQWHARLAGQRAWCREADGWRTSCTFGARTTRSVRGTARVTTDTLRTCTNILIS